MAHVISAHTQQSRIVEFAARLTEAVSLFGTWVRRLKQRRQLMGLLDQPDYLIKDLGLHRHEISREALKPFWRE